MPRVFAASMLMPNRRRHDPRRRTHARCDQRPRRGHDPDGRILRLSARRAISGSRFATHGMRPARLGWTPGGLRRGLCASFFIWLGRAAPGASAPQTPPVTGDGGFAPNPYAQSFVRLRQSESSLCHTRDAIACRGSPTPRHLRPRPCRAHCLAGSTSSSCSRPEHARELPVYSPPCGSRRCLRRRDTTSESAHALARRPSSSAARPRVTRSRRPAARCVADRDLNVQTRPGRRHETALGPPSGSAHALVQVAGGSYNYCASSLTPLLNALTIGQMSTSALAASPR